MGIFTRRVTTPQIAYGEPTVKAAAGVSHGVGNFMNYLIGNDEQRALSIPTISRAVDLLSSMVGALELKQYVKQWTGERYEKIHIESDRWMDQPDPRATRNFIMSNTLRDLFFHGRAFWVVTSRYATGLPSSFTWLPAAAINTPNQAGPQWFGQADKIMFNGEELDINNCIQFISPIQGILAQGSRAINIGLHLDQYADRMSIIETVPGYLQQSGGETMSGDELGDLAAGWAKARKNGNVIGALNDYVKFVEFKNDPATVIGEQRKYQALEYARLCNIPAYLVSAPTEGSSMTYSNAEGARKDLLLFGALPFIDCIQQTLSMDNVIARGRFVHFDLEEYLAAYALTDVAVEQPLSEMESA